MKNLNKENKTELFRLLKSKSPYNVGLKSHFWSVKTVKSFIQEKYSLSVPNSTVRDYMYKIGCDFKNIQEAKKNLAKQQSYKEIKKDAIFENSKIILLQEDIAKGFIKIAKVENNEYLFTNNINYLDVFNNLSLLSKEIYVFIFSPSVEIKKFISKNKIFLKEKKIKFFFFNLINSVYLDNLLEKDNSLICKNVEIFKIIDFEKEEKKKRALLNKKRREKYKDSKKMNESVCNSLDDLFESPTYTSDKLLDLKIDTESTDNELLDFNMGVDIDEESIDLNNIKIKNFKN